MVTAADKLSVANAMMQTKAVSQTALTTSILCLR